ncbi:MAG TPA: Rid family hydrolase [Solirubrobacterales bacterium]|jgi:enamine deaminase RidA (YjgF/YER057c/UK114 family)/acyl-CoA hydrolase|nr:Rid family hydrolase [Solirubrobacterales bacterium]
MSVRLSGPQSGYHDAAGAGGVIALAGQTAAAEVIAAAGFAAEFESALRRLVAALEEAGGKPGDLLQLRIFVTDLAAYVDARQEIAATFREQLGSHYPASTLVEVGALVGGAGVEIEGLAASPRGKNPASVETPATPGGLEHDAVIRLRLSPADARYAGGIAAGSKAMEIFADLETELALREGGDEGLCVAYDMVEFLAPLRVGDFVEGRARVVERGRTSRRISTEIHKLRQVDEHGVLVSDEPVLAARASVTIVVGVSDREGA